MKLPPVNRVDYTATAPGEVDLVVTGSGYYKNFLIQVEGATPACTFDVEMTTGSLNDYLQYSTHAVPVGGQLLIETELCCPPLGGGIKVKSTGNLTAAKVSISMSDAPNAVER